MKRVLWPVTAALILSCAAKPAWWRINEIAVLAEPDDWRQLRTELSQTFERIIPTPQPEKTFELALVSNGDFKRFSTFRFLLVAGTMETTGRTGRLIRKLLSDRTLKRSVESGESFMFVERDQWAKGQLMLILVSKDIATLQERIRNHRAFCDGIFESELAQASLRTLFNRGERTAEASRLFGRYGWSIRIPADCIVNEDSVDGLVRFYRGNPEHRLFVHWMTGGGLDPDRILKERNRIGENHLGKENVADGFWETRSARFLDRHAVRLSGLWENEDKETGGPFIHYAFHDSVSGRTYMIDGVVYAPGERKLPVLRLLEAWMGTFQIPTDATGQQNAKDPMP